MSSLSSSLTDSSESAPTTTPSSRKSLNYVSRACDFCKGRHKKCDGGRPCVACKQRNRSCVYSQKVKKRGPKPKSKVRAKRSVAEVTQGEPPSSDVSPPSLDLPEELPKTSVVESLPPFGQPIKLELPNQIKTSLDLSIKKEEKIPNCLKTALLEHLNKQKSPSWKRKCHPMCNTSQNAQNVATTLKAMFAALLRELPWYPNFLIMQHSRMEEYCRLARAPVLGSSEEQLADSFLYCTLFAHGSRLIGNETLASEFSNKSFIIMNQLFLSPGTTNKEEIVEKILLGLILFVPFVASNNQPSRARAAIMHAYNLCNTYRDVLPPTLVHRVYVHMVGISAHHDRDHWFFMANRLGTRASTLENRMLMALTVTFPMEEKSSYSHEDNSSDLTPKLYCSFQQYLNDCEDVTQFCANSQMGYYGQKYDPNMIATFQAIIYCCKCFMQYKYGSDNTQTILQLAQKAISFASNITETTAPVLVCLSRILMILLEYNSTLLVEGMKILCNLGRNVAYCQKLFEHPLVLSGLDPSEDPLCSQTIELWVTILQALSTAPSPLTFSLQSLQYDYGAVPSGMICTSPFFNRNYLPETLDPLFPHSDILMEDTVDPKMFYDAHNFDSSVVLNQSYPPSFNQVEHTVFVGGNQNEYFPKM